MDLGVLDTERYRLDAAPAAKGSQGSVWFGVRDDGLPVAVKVAAPGTVATDALENEIAVLRALVEVDGVVPCLDVVRWEDRPAFVMPRYRDDLAGWLTRAMREPGPGTLTEILTLTARLARTLAAVHRLPVSGGRLVHRDVKPDNVFLDAEGQPFLGDFGGAMAIDGLTAVELALFGTPMWAPLDQILPGKAIPDPTWDTYALCVILYAALTGSRPAYQADPRQLLTTRGRELWAAAKETIKAETLTRREKAWTFARIRRGTTAAELVDVTGRAALVAGDRQELARGIERLAGLARLEDTSRRLLERGLWNLLVRGLSPVSHPSPPNRYRDAEELAEQLEELLALVREQRREATTGRLAELLAGPMDGPDVPIDTSVDESPDHTFREGPGLALPLVIGCLVVMGAAAWASWAGLIGRAEVAAQVQVPAATLLVDGVSVRTDPFLLDRVEVSWAAWQACVDGGACPALDAPTAPEAPAFGVTFEEAGAYCAFVGERLPTEAEWLAAAGSGTWPWGEAAPTCAHANALGCAEYPRPAGPEDGASAQGALDLAGNAWEWARSRSGRPVLLGGAVSSPPSELGRAGRRTPNPGERPPLAGVRCARSLSDR